jgi:hypothetical protein
VDGPPEAQRRRTDDQAFTGSGCVLNTNGLSIGGLFHIAAMDRASPSEPVVKEAEEWALADVEDRADALIEQLEDVDRHGIHMFSILSLISSFFYAFV